MSLSAEQFLAVRRGHFISGEWRLPQSDQWLEDRDPATGEIIGCFADGDNKDVNAAVEAARAALRLGAWPSLSPKARCELLWRFAALIEEDRDTLATLEYRDVGRSRFHIHANEVSSAADVFRYFAGWCTKISGRVAAPTAGGDQSAYISKHPVGVAGLIIPWNFPLLGTSWKLAPALAAGCTVIVKPSEESPMTALRLAELSKQAGVPDGVINVVTGRGSSAGAALALHPDVDKISFTGSTQTGRAILAAASGNLKRISLELGGKSPGIVLEDADITKAAQSCALGAFYNAGQICAAGTRIYAQYKIFDAFVCALKDAALSLTVGPGDDPASVIGPMISREARARVHKYVNTALRDGAQLVAGGVIPDGPGAFYPPTILTGVQPGAAIDCDELFGPVVTVAPFKSIPEAIRRANDSAYGLTAKIWTRDIDAAHHLTSQLKAGTIEINGSGGPDANLPFGGVKQSGWGRELGAEGLDQFLELKTVRIWHDLSRFSGPDRDIV